MFGIDELKNKVAWLEGVVAGIMNPDTGDYAQAKRYVDGSLEALRKEDISKTNKNVEGIESKQADLEGRLTGAEQRTAQVMQEAETAARATGRTAVDEYMNIFWATHGLTVVETPDKAMPFEDVLKRTQEGIGEQRYARIFQALLEGKEYADADGIHLRVNNGEGLDLLHVIGDEMFMYESALGSNVGFWVTLRSGYESERDTRKPKIKISLFLEYERGDFSYQELKRSKELQEDLSARLLVNLFIGEARKKLQKAEEKLKEDTRYKVNHTSDLASVGRAFSNVYNNSDVANKPEAVAALETFGKELVGKYPLAASYIQKKEATEAGAKE